MKEMLHLYTRSYCQFLRKPFYQVVPFWILVSDKFYTRTSLRFMQKYSMLQVYYFIGDSTYQYVIPNAPSSTKESYPNQPESNISKKRTSHSISIANSVNLMKNRQTHDPKLVTLSHDTHSEIGDSNPLYSVIRTYYFHFYDCFSKNRQDQHGKIILLRV
jgi:hypothetical protein